jgi:non-specific serine/threonine protein kinase
MLELSVSLLGPFAASLNQRPLPPFRTKSVQALLIYLLCQAERPQKREALMALLWPGLPPTSAQANLRQTLYRLRKLVPEVKGKDGETAVPFLLTNRQTIQINPAAGYILDVDTFAKSDPAQAIPLYRGDFLVNFYLADSEPFEAWVTGRRAEYRRRVLEMLAAETVTHIHNADYEGAIHLAQRQLEIDNLRESSHRQLMEAWARSGRRREAISHYNNLRQLLQDELAIEPSRETHALVELIRADDYASAASGAPQQSVGTSDKPPSPKHNLPRRLTTFIGREREMAAITDLITQHRLVMLTGVGGIGKTNLCLQVGRKLRDAFSDGVWLVELAPIGDPALVPAVTAHTLGLRESADRPILEILRAYLLEKNCLILLDNCEHLIDAAAQLVETVLRAGPDVKILASSREALAVPGEIPYRVPPLSNPTSGQPLSLAEWDRYDALRLFVERATTSVPDFQVTQGNIVPLAQICRRLDGIPLALELAAARVRVLTIAQIAQRLDDRFRLLTGGSRTALPRQQTLQAMIDWSWELLAESERRLLGRLSVFAGGMSLEAVEAVCWGDGLEVDELLDGLSELANKSLVVAQREPGQERRYRLLETVRQYAQERLLETGGGGEFRQRHLDYYLELGERAEEELVGPDQVAWLNRLERELDNIRRALNWAYETDTEKGLRLAAGLLEFWNTRGNISEGVGWIGQLLAGSERVCSAIRAKALFVQGYLSYYLLHLERSWLLLEESLALYREGGDRSGMAGTLRYLGYQLCAHGGKPGEGQSLLRQSLGIYRELEDRLGVAGTLQVMGFIAGASNNFKEAAVYYEESLALYRECGHLGGIASVLLYSGQMALWQGDYEAARSRLEESLSYHELLEHSGEGVLNHLGQLYFRLEAYEKARGYLEQSISINKQTGKNLWRFWGEVWLGYCFLWTGELAEAETILRGSQQQFKEVDDVGGEVFATEGLAILAVRRRQAEVAAQLFAWADATRETFQHPRPPIEQADVDRETAIILEMIGQEAYAAAYAAGKAMTMDQVVAYDMEDQA